ncbi:MAG: hypothetical protein EBV64_06045 [Oxalobacteraceae bacterium]|nr:hypothetical protein [Oxalobacteraceae bacterium]
MPAPFDQLTFSGSASYVNLSNKQFLFLLKRKKNHRFMSIFLEKFSLASSDIDYGFLIAY